MNILLQTFDISPYRGSEASVSWNYVSNMSRYHHIVVIYGHGAEEISDYLLNHELPNVTFISIPLELGNGTGFLFDIKYNLRYRRWQKMAYEKAKEICKTMQIDVIHYLNPIGFKEPSFLWKIEKPYIWGPMKAVDNIPIPLFPCLTFSKRVYALFRRVIHNSLFIIHPRVRRAVERADTIFAAAPRTSEMLMSIYKKPSVYLPENGITKMERITPVHYEGGTLKMIWIGRVNDQLKGVKILVEALQKTKTKNWELHLLGNGNLPKEWKSEKIIEHGLVSREEVLSIMQSSHLHIITSLAETNPTVLWEAMSWAVPTMTLDHCGMSAVVCERCGIKIQIHSYRQVINDIRNQIDDICRHPERIRMMSEGVIECSKKFMWENRINLFNSIYNELVKRN